MAGKYGQSPVGQNGSAPVGWWQERKAEAWKKFQAMPMPRRSDEDWRFATIAAIQLGDFKPGQKGSTSAESLLKRSTASFPHAAKAVFSNDRLLHIEGGEELAKQGVVFESLAGALQKQAQS